MTPWTRTAAYLGVAAALGAAAYLTRPVPPEAALLADQGSPLAPDLVDPLAVRSLEVISYDETAAQVRAFKVAWDGKRWAIPSAFNYPADAQQGMSEAASVFVGALRERVAGENPADHARFGVVAPDDDAAVGAAGRGTRVTMRDDSGKTLADIIVGLPVPADTGAGDRRFVRPAGQNRVFVTSMQGGFSTRLTDWVDTDLLALQPWEVRTLVIDRYDVNEEKGTLDNGRSITLTKSPIDGAPPPGQPPTPPWSLQAEPGGPPGPGERVNDEAVQLALDGLAGLRLAGVKPKPANLARMFGAAEGDVRVSMVDQLSLQRHGFFLSPDGRLVANEGQAAIELNSGIVYQLWFGEVATEGDLAAAGGYVGAKEPSPDRKTDSRYFMVTVAFDGSKIPAPVKPPDLLAAEAAVAAAGDAATDDAKARLKTAQESFAQTEQAHAKTIADTKARAERLAQRFAPWYFIVDAAALERIRPGREQLVTSAAPALPGAPADAPVPALPETPAPPPG